MILGQCKFRAVPSHSPLESVKSCAEHHDRVCDTACVGILRLAGQASRSYETEPGNTAQLIVNSQDEILMNMARCGEGGGMSET